MDNVFGGNCGNEELDFERYYGLRLHIHTRDFEVGVPIYSNIQNCLVNSRKAIFFLSR